MAFDFPSSPTTGQTYSVTGGPTYVYNGTTWVVLTPGNQFNRTVFTATAGQTTFTMNYVVGAIDVYRNGVKLAPADFTATNGTSIVLANGCTVGDTVEVISYPMITYSDAVKRTGDTMTGALVLPSGGLTVGTNQLLVDSTGKIGVGVTPVERFQVKGTTNQNIALGGSIALANSAAISAINDAGTANIPMELRYATNLVFYDGGGERARFDSNGVFSCLLTNSQNSNGYTRLPNGVYLQWGTAGASTGGITTNFPIAFPTACWGVVAVNTNQANPPAPTVSYSRTNFTMTVFAGGPTCSWFSVGY